ncbi:transposase [Microvirga aerilata]|uniref:Transposase n=1 Tax=Microvirga aerilata TaxID=670292 RepID=A0A937CZH0_9HYPH|nr:transposase [Microvirga aerilata]
MLTDFRSFVRLAYSFRRLLCADLHSIRSSLAFVAYKDCKAVAAASKEIYRAKDAEAGQAALEAFATSTWGCKHEAIASAWRRHKTDVGDLAEPLLHTLAERVVIMPDCAPITRVRPRMTGPSYPQLIDEVYLIRGIISVYENVCGNEQYRSKSSK